MVMQWSIEALRGGGGRSMVCVGASVFPSVRLWTKEPFVPRPKCLKGFPFLPVLY